MDEEETKHRVIQKDYAGSPSLDYTFLRNQGIRLIQELSGENWTDFNIHDPGITILEHLCYALTDLAYRTSFPIADLLARPDGTINKQANAFIPAGKILSCAPVSVKDFRKLVIDEVREITNVWLEPVVSSFAFQYSKGIYNVIIQINHLIQQSAGTEEEKRALKADVIHKVRAVLESSRTIGICYSEYIVLEPQFIEVSAQIIINKQAVPEELLAQVYYRIEQVLNPTTVFYAEQELIAQGYTIENIYNGPLLKRGIIPDDELKELTPEVDKSDLIKAVSEMRDVISINTFEIKEYGTTGYTTRPIRLKEYHYPVLQFDPQALGIKLYHDKLPVSVKDLVFYNMLQRLRDTFNKNFVSDIHNANKEKSAGGTYMQPEKYESFQNLFPAVYRIGSEGIEKNAAPLRKAQAKQLKAYLMFFEQLMANHLSQLANLNSLFSVNLTTPNAHTYFSQPLYDVAGAEHIIKAFTNEKNISWDSFKENKENAYIEGLKNIAESDETFKTRKNRIFDHLLSRFNLVPDRYPVILFKQLYQANAEEKRVDEELIWKSRLLSNILPFTYHRVSALNYNPRKTEEIIQPGFEFNMHLLLHIQNSRKRLSKAVTGYLANDVNKDTKKSFDSNQPTIKTITFNGEELNVLSENDREHIASSFRFRQRSFKFFEWGINKKNYRVVPDFQDKDRHIVLFKNPEEQHWNIVRQYPQRKEARDGLNHLTRQLTSLSLQSEGFYMVEHLLLVPPRKAPVFGFIFYDNQGKSVLSQKHPITFYEREEIIGKIFSLAEEDSGVQNAELLTKLMNLCSLIPVDDNRKIFNQQSVDSQERKQKKTDQLISDIMNSLLVLKSERTKLYPNFEYTIALDGIFIKESFYDSQLTVVLPAWPVRFQHEGFRKFAEGTFRNNLPVHIKANFLWLGISKIRIFEEFYFLWRDSVKEGSASDQNTEPLLSTFLRNELKSKQ